MAVTDPVDARLLAVLAEMGKATVHDVAARIGMDPKEVAYRLVGLSGNGLPLLVGVESDPNGLRAALAGGNAHSGTHPQTQRPQAQQPPHQGRGGPPSPWPAQGQATTYGTPSGPYTVRGAQSGPYTPPTTSGPVPAQGTPNATYPARTPPGGGHQQPPPAQARPAPAPGLGSADPVLSTWGPPQSASWARSDREADTAAATKQANSPGAAARTGDVQETTGLEGEDLAIQLLEVQDPADFLFGAAGYQLGENERAVVVHTEITNRGRIPFVSLPDNYLELVTSDGRTVPKDPMSLTSRPPHKIGVQPGETAGGHTLYVLSEETRITTVRWSPRPEPDERTRSWSLED